MARTIAVPTTRALTRLGFTIVSNIRFWDIFIIFAANMNNLTKQKVYKRRYKYFCEVIKLERETHKISQEELANKLGIKQSFISKTESGDRRLDVIELLEYCEAMNISLTEFVFRLEGKLQDQKLLSPKMKQSHLKWLDLYKKYYNQT